MSLEKNVIEEQSITDVNYELLKKQFPHAVSINDNGKYVIDPQKLQMSLDPSLAQIKEDGYGLNWVGKKEAYHNAFTKNYKVLKPLKDDSKKWDETENILIKGDNLDALKILRQNYFESIKMIYIDPPYNTKNDGFVYNDDFTSSTEQTLEELGYDKEYIDYIENIQGAKTHSGWLSFMYPRLLLAKELLKKEDGVVFISIDDNELIQLRLLCDEIFGEENFLAQIMPIVNPGGRDYNQIAVTHEYLLIYASGDEVELNEIKKDIEFKLFDNNGGFELRDLRNRNPKFHSGNRPNLFYSIFVNPALSDEYGNCAVSLIKDTNYSIEIKPYNSTKKESVWRWGTKKLEENIIKDKPELSQVVAKKKKDGGWTISEKNRRMTTKVKSVWDETEMRTEEGTRLIRSLFDFTPFDHPKPLDLIKRVIEIGSNENDIVLDFFAGSGTTAHAVIDLNALVEDSNRKFICVQWDEKTSENSVSRENGFETIFDITKARIDKAGEQIAKGDIGFRTFEIVEDQKQKIYQKSLEVVNQDDLLSLMEKPDISSNEEILYNLFVAETLPLSTKHQELIKDKLYLASNVAFILGDITSDELVEALKDKKECEYITVYSPNISNDKFTLEIESNISKLGIKSDKLRFRG
ncbi:site-specific DNA-methyltransferase [Aliarcobacter cryaerophilus]|uniref:site-specific DNA-methyltransferase (adenine-specific) n=1 Tax=Aliarcobacter cryaerophilus TaxID=28198 RepID=A0A2S9T4J3_9BACT|nr:site-specific DNA-methyltransferase [Aliarcobacter cryaerophilus]PRM93748.1 site-specific DNA-methyltransferase [Aliarcobacter cryaerophilus]